MPAPTEGEGEKCSAEIPPSSSPGPPQLPASLLYPSWFWTLGPDPDTDAHALPGASAYGCEVWVLLGGALEATSEAGGGLKCSWSSTPRAMGPGEGCVVWEKGSLFLTGSQEACGYQGPRLLPHLTPWLDLPSPHSSSLK